MAAIPDLAAERKLSPIVETNEGQVQGLISNGVTKFLGIPYAAPPVGNLRWRPPVDHAPWTNVLRTTRFAPICAQTTTLGVFSGPPNKNQNCLYLNVFTPNLNPSALLPVIVYIHGGGNYDGETPGLDGSKLASQGKVVVVTMEYRLNLMGFLAHPALDNEGHLFGNYGILDQQAALKWVQLNIARFGGNEDNVTVGGQSSGAIDTMINLVSPRATGLFDRAICQSACLADYPLATKAAAETVGVAFAVAAGCGSGAGPAVAKCLRNLSAAKIEELAGTASAPSKFTISSGIVDGQIVPDEPLTLLKSGRFNRVPLMNGSTKDEMNFFLAITEYWSNRDNALRMPLTAEQYLDDVNTSFVSPAYSDGTAAKVLALYPLTAFRSPQLAWDRVASDTRVCSVRRLDQILAPQIPVYTYEFSDITAPSYFPDMPGMKLEAYHTADIQYLFPLWHGGPRGIQQALNRQQRKLSGQMVSAWANFARAGNPNGTGNRPWPRYAITAGAPAWLIEDVPDFSSLTDRQYSLLHHCAFWDSAGPRL
jgi:para-nitrobenzyl esterase